MVVLFFRFGKKDVSDQDARCLIGFAEEGRIQIPDRGISANFSYDVLRNNINYRSFQKESLYSRSRLWDCNNCPKPDYKKFVDYYGRVRRD